MSPFRVQILAGCLCFVAAAGWLRSSPLDIDWPLLMTAFGAMVLVPLGLEVLRREAVTNWTLIPGLTAWLFAAWVLMAVFLRGPKNSYTPHASGIWLVVTVMIALMASHEFLNDRKSLARRVMLSGPIMLAIGGAWYAADRNVMRPFGFDFLIVRLTAAHFHFAGFVLPIATGLLLHHWPNPARWLRVSSIGVIAGVPLVATGITLTRMGAAVEWECTFAAGFALCALVTGLAQVALAWQSRAQNAATRMMLAFSGLSLAAGMALALLYALRPWLPLPWLHLPRMWAWHGSINVFGFALPGMIAWLLWRRSPAPGAAA